MAEFAKAFAVWLTCEGVESAGVLQSEYDTYRRRHGLPPRTVANITDAETQGLLQEFYWQPDNLGVLPQPWANFLLVEGSNLPYGAAVKIAQGWLAWSDAYGGPIDGIMGPETIAAMTKRADLAKIAATGCVTHYAVESPETIQKGLQNRLKKLLESM